MPNAKRPRKKCGAKKKHTDEKCRLSAGFGTSHPGFGKCKYHGGSSPSGKKAAEAEAARVEVPVEDLLRSKELGELVATLKARGDITDISQELALARAVAIDFINRAEELERALLRWSASWDRKWQETTAEIVEEAAIAIAEENPQRYWELMQQVPDPLTYMDRPKKVIDLGDSVKMLKDVVVIADTIVKHQEAGSIPARDVEVLMVEIANVVERVARERLGDVTARAGLLAAIERGFAEIRLPSWEAAGDRYDESVRDGGRGMDA